jgi:acetolactate synthase-1/3 small subunit
MQLVDVYRARVVDVSPDSLVVETTGTEDKIDSLVEVLRPFGITEIVRTGRIAMVRGTGVPDAAARRSAHAIANQPASPADVSAGSV